MGPLRSEALLSASAGSPVAWLSSSKFMNRLFCRRCIPTGQKGRFNFFQDKDFTHCTKPAFFCVVAPASRRRLLNHTHRAKSPARRRRPGTSFLFVNNRIGPPTDRDLQVHFRE